MRTYLAEAFALECPDAADTDPHYVALVASHQAYGGPEEGGWWYDVQHVEGYRLFANRRDAEAMAERIQATATELTAMARADHGRYCQATCDWLDARGLDANFLPEPDGPTEYSVLVCSELPVFDNRKPHYE